MKARRAYWLAPAIVAVLLVACTPAAAPGVGTSPLPPAAHASGGSQPVETPPASKSENGAAVAGIPGDLLNAILDDASQRTGLASEVLVVRRAEAVTWSDGSLGCPMPGMFYTQALVDGYQIVLDAGGQSLDYRAGDNLYFRLCDQ